MEPNRNMYPYGFLESGRQAICFEVIRILQGFDGCHSLQGLKCYEAICCGFLPN